jgi:TRAP-type C4-dicarboxylate transport system permease large subunit
LEILKSSYGVLEAGQLIGALAVMIFSMYALSRAMIWANFSQTLIAVFAEVIPNKYIFLLVFNILFNYHGHDHR